MANPMVELFDKQGQSPWLDFIRRNMLHDGGMKRYIEQDGIRGVTANPTIFAQAIGAGDDYDAQIAGLTKRGVAPADMFEQIAIEDIRAAADLLRPVYDAADGGDGYVSIEVSPDKAFQTQPTIDEAKRWWANIDRPNLFIKIPATSEGIPAIEECIAAGININITLIFAISFYEQVMEAYIRGLERRVASGQDVRRVHSVASFFVSRVDTATDKRLDAKILAAGETDRPKLQSLLGKAAVANAKIAYERYIAVFGAARFKTLAKAGAASQRPLWASTGTKNKAYSDILYVQELIGPDTVNTMPPATIDAFRDHGVVRRTIDEGVAAAHAVMRDLAAAGVSIDEVTDELQRDGVAAFSKSFEQINAITAEKAGMLKAKAGAA
jgi:transaldolase / glucose-6-phosphate isomerase